MVGKAEPTFLGVRGGAKEGLQREYANRNGQV
jgi:hypothetical protein